MARAVQRRSGALNRNRYFPSVRTIMLVRFDPHVRDRLDPAQVRLESAPDFNQVQRGQIAATNSIAIAGAPAGRVVSQSINKVRAAQNEAAALTLPRDDFRAALANARVNLAGALAKLPSRDGLSRFFDLQPLQSTRRVNSYRLADELDLTVDWKAVPLDSRLIRAALVFHYEGTVPPDAWVGNQRERNPNDPLPTGFLIPASGANLKFVGQVDEIGDTHDESGDVLSIKCRDLRSILIDTKFPQNAGIRISPGTNLAEVILQILKTHDRFSILRGPFLRVERELPQLDAGRYDKLVVSAKEKHRQATNAQPLVKRKSSKGGGDATYWDIITELCVSHCLRPDVEKDMLVLLEPRTLYKRTPEVITQPGVPSFPKPGGHRLDIGDTATVRRMVYGVNIASLRFNRKLARIQTPVVEVRAVNPDANEAKDRFIKVFHPTIKEERRRLRQEASNRGEEATHMDATGKKTEIKTHVVVIQGITDRSQLKGIAEQVYEGMGRQALGVTFSTDDVASFSDNPKFDPNLDPDLLDLRAGDPVRILVTPTERRGAGRLLALSELNLLLQKVQKRAGGGEPEFRDAVAYFKVQGFKQQDAEALVRLITTANLPEEFRANTVSISYDGEGAGFSVQVDLRDYVRARADPDDPAQTGGLIGAVSPGQPPRVPLPERLI